jgi:hypothetical protein
MTTKLTLRLTLAITALLSCNALSFAQTALPTIDIGQRHKSTDRNIKPPARPLQEARAPASRVIVPVANEQTLASSGAQLSDLGGEVSDLSLVPSPAANRRRHRLSQSRKPDGLDISPATPPRAPAGNPDHHQAWRSGQSSSEGSPGTSLKPPPPGGVGLNVIPRAWAIFMPSASSSR